MNKCNVIRDLLPLYADNICSEDSREMVEEHLSSCKECKQESEDYRYNTGIGDESEKNSIDEMKAVADFSKKLKKRNFIKIIVSVVLSLAVIISAGYFIFVKEFYVPYSEGILEVKIPVDGGIDVWVNLDNYKRLEYDAVYKENNEIDIYITAKQTVFTKIVKDNDPSDNFWRTTGFICVSAQDGATDYIHPDNKVANIYYTDMTIEEVDSILYDDNEENDIEVKDASYLVWSAE